METALYWLARGTIALLQALPLTAVARLGRLGGALAYVLDARHRRVALANLTACFGAERSSVDIRALARENFRRIGESYACLVKTSSMNAAQLLPHLEMVGAEKLRSTPSADPVQSRVVAIGHFGCFEIYARTALFVPEFRPLTTYRGLRQSSVNHLLQALRARSGCRYFERRSEAAALKAEMLKPGRLLGLLADQHAGQGGRRLPFFGRDCSTSAAPAVFALRYRCRLHTMICFRTALARWRLEVGDEIPTHENGRPRSVEAIMADVNRVYEVAVRRDPANWFWVHNRWKLAKRQQPEPRLEPGLEEGL
jgi:lauroyl/myristoyl acyltransferase